MGGIVARRRRWVGPRSLGGITGPALLLAVFGCAAEYPAEKSTATAYAPARSPAPAGAVISADSYGGEAAGGAAPAAAPPMTPPADSRADKPPGQAAEDVAKTTPRKIIYNARVTLVVESISALSGKLLALVKESGGYVSETDQTSYTHAQRTASWTVRVPVERFDAFLSAVGRLGEVQQNHLDSQDVTQEYYDTEARIANKQKEESRLQKHLAESTGKLEDILAVERELTRVRGEIETMQGRIRYLANLSALSTVTITATEVQDYKPPVAPTFATQIARTFHRSAESVAEFGKAIVLFAVALAPWLPVLALLALPLVVWWARRRRAPAVLTRVNT